MRADAPMLNRRSLLAFGGAACASLLMPARAGAASPVAGIEGKAFGTGWSVTLPADSEQRLDGLRARIDALLAGLDLAFSPWRADSIVGRFNAGTEREMAVGGEVAEVADAALAIAGASDGHFDPTVGPLVGRWGFGPIHGAAARPGGWRGLAAGNGHLAKTEPELTLDLCGIAKGHALDRMVSLLGEAGHGHFLIDLGGELAARGSHPSGRPWRVGIEDPRPGVDALAGALRLDGMAVATSGDRINGYDIGARRYSHIIDPATCEPVDSALASVSVLAPSGREADGWATALMAAGQAGPDLAGGARLAALFLFRDGQGGLTRVATGAFDKHVA